MTWWKPRPAKSQDIPVYVPVERRPVAPEHARESTGEALRHVRTHIAAMAGELSSLNVKLGMLAARVEQLHGPELRKIYVRIDQVHQAVLRKGDES